MAFSLLEAVFLAIVQGMTEWIPVSSSGHLAIAEMALGIQPPLIFNLAVHLGTLAAVILVFAEDVKSILKATPRMFSFLFRGRLPDRQDADARMALYLFLATLPAAIFGFLAKGLAEELFFSPTALSGFFILTGFVLLSTRRMKPRHLESVHSSMVVGIAQIIAIFPGVSRSGITISAGLHSGLQRDEAAHFSFLLSIPLIIGSTVFQALSVSTPSGLYPHLALGMLVAFVVGFFSIRFLKRIVHEGKLHDFAPYCLLVGVGLIIWGIM